jgi:predicted nucleotidyltransferase
MRTQITRADLGRVGLKQVYLFGSALRTDDPADLDLLLVYDPGVIAPRDAHRLGALVRAALGTTLPVETVLLTKAEAATSRFAEREAADLVWDARPDCSLVRPTQA